MLGIARAGSGIGKAVVDPTHNSLIADYYDIPSRPRVYSFHRAANAVGAIIGPLTAGIIAYRWGWRWPFIIFTFPTLIFVVLAWRLREPKRGVFERRAAGASEEAAQTEEARPSFAESWRIVWKIDSLRRIWYALPFLAVSLIGFSVLSALLYEQIFHLDERARGVIAACVEPAQLIGLIVGARIATRVMAKGGAEAILGFLSKVAFVICVRAHRVRARALPLGHDRRELRDHGDGRDPRSRDLRRPQPRDPTSRPVDGLLGRVAVDHPRPRHPADHRLHR